jgi:hypothetical protein
VQKNMATKWISMRQKTLETLIHGLELVASWIPTELTIEIRYMLWSLGVALYGPACYIEST